MAMNVRSCLTYFTTTVTFSFIPRNLSFLTSSSLLSIGAFGFYGSQNSKDTRICPTMCHTDSFMVLPNVSSYLFDDSHREFPILKTTLKLLQYVHLCFLILFLSCSFYTLNNCIKQQTLYYQYSHHCLERAEGNWGLGQEWLPVMLVWTYEGLLLDQTSPLFQLQGTTEIIAVSFQYISNKYFLPPPSYVSGPESLLLHHALFRFFSSFFQWYWSLPFI